MAGDNVLQITDSNFEQEVLKSDKPVLVDFWAEWCQPCRRLAPTIEKLATDYAQRVKVGKLDTDSNHATASKFGISAIPTVIFSRAARSRRSSWACAAKKTFATPLMRRCDRTTRFD